MTTAADSIFNWIETQDQGLSEAALPKLSSPQEVAERLFSELGLDRLLEEALAQIDPLVREVSSFAAAAGDEAARQAVRQEVALEVMHEVGEAAFAAPSAGPAQMARPAEGAVPPIDEEAMEDGYFVEVPFVTDALYEREGTWMADRAEGDEASWLGVDPSQPREWTPEDLMMLIYRDRAHVSEAAARLADISDHSGDDMDEAGYARAA